MKLENYEVNSSMNDELISIIVPVYNAASFLEQCLDALINQTYPSLEIILVDDASTDESLSICRAYAIRDPRISLIQNEKNSGQGACRNFGLKIAKGSYIGFSDSDDVPDLNQFERLHSLIKKTDSGIAVCSFRINQECKKENSPVSARVINAKQATVEFLTNPFFGAFSWNKLFRADIIKAGFYPPEQCYIGYEDIAYIPMVCLNTEKIAVSDEQLYYYRQHPSSVTCSVFNPRKLNQLNAYERLVPVLEARFPDLKPLIYEKAWFGVMGVFNSLSLSDMFSDKNLLFRIIGKAKEYWVHTVFTNSRSRLRFIIFSFALKFPRFYTMLFRMLYRFRNCI